MAQAQGSESRILLATENTFKSAPEYEVISCEAAFTGVGSGVAETFDSADYRAGSNAIMLSVVASTITAGNMLAWLSLGGINLASLSYAIIDIKPNVSIAASTLALVFAQASALGSAVASVQIGAAPANVWTTLRVEIPTPSALTSLVSAGVKLVATVDAQIKVDRMRMIRPMAVLRFVSEDMSLKRNTISSRTLRTNRNPVMPVRGNKDVSGPLEIELQAYCQRALYYLFGSVTTAVVGGAYSHTFSIGSLPSFTYEKGFTDLDYYFLYSGCRVSQLRLTVPQEGFIGGAFDIMGAKGERNTVSFDDAFTDDGFQPFDAFSGEISVDGTAVATVTAVDLTINNNLDGSSYTIDRTNPGERRYLPARKVAVTGTLTALFEDVALLTLAEDFTECRLQLDFSLGTGLGTADNEKLTIYMDEVKFAHKDPGIPGDEGIKVVLDYEAYYDDDADASAVRAVLLNMATTV